MNPIIKKITKMLKLSMDQDGTPEGETAARLARRMMAAHAIEMDAIDLSADIDPDPIEELREWIPMSVWRRQLAHQIAKHCSCFLAYVSKRGVGQMIWVTGHRTDIEIFKYLYAICERQIESAARDYVSNLPWMFDTGDLKRMGNSFRRSAVDGLGYKLHRIRVEEGEQNPGGTALVRSRAANAQAHAEANSKIKTQADNPCEMNAHGYLAGTSVNLSASIGAEDDSRSLTEGTNWQ